MYIYIYSIYIYYYIIIYIYYLVISLYIYILSMDTNIIDTTPSFHLNLPIDSSPQDVWQNCQRHPDLELHRELPVEVP